MNQSLLDIQNQIKHQRDHNPLFFTCTEPHALLAYCCYLTGFTHAIDEISTGFAPNWHPNDIPKDHAVLLAYIRVEQLKLRRALENPTPPTPMGGDRSPDTAMKGLDDLEKASENPEDPEPFDEFTGSMGGAQ